MTLAALFSFIMEYRAFFILFMLTAPWVAWLICLSIPGRWEEPYVLSANFGFVVLALFFWSGYLAYATNVDGGWQSVVQNADFMLLLLPPYYFFASRWVSKKRMELNDIPAYRLLQGMAMMALVYLVLSWFGNRVRFIFFSFMPFNVFLWLLAAVLAFGYFGYRKIFD